jgi:hypothetical protein
MARSMPAEAVARGLSASTRSAADPVGFENVVPRLLASGSSRKASRRGGSEGQPHSHQIAVDTGLLSPATSDVPAFRSVGASVSRLQQEVPNLVSTESTDEPAAPNRLHAEDVLHWPTSPPHIDTYLLSAASELASVAHCKDARASPMYLAVAGRMAALQFGGRNLRPRSGDGRNCPMRHPGSQTVAVRLLYRCQPLLDRVLDFEFRCGSGTGIRTLNLAVNRSLRPVQKLRSEFTE